jgi:hypothetical protein
MHRSIRHTIALWAFVLAGALAANAGATPAAARSGAAATSFCSVSKNVAKQLADLASNLSDTAKLAQKQATLKTELTTIKRAGPSLKSAAPRSLRPKVTTVLGFVGLAYAKLSAARWSFVTLASQPTAIATLEAASNRADPAMTAVTTYYRKVCKFRV